MFNTNSHPLFKVIRVVVEYGLKRLRINSNLYANWSGLIHNLCKLCISFYDCVYCFFFFSKGRWPHDFPHWNGTFLNQKVPFNLVFLSLQLLQSFRFLTFLFRLSPYDFIFVTTLHQLWAQWQILSAFQSSAKNNHLFFYSHWLCYNAATLRGDTRGQSIISPLPIQAAVWLLSAKHRNRTHNPLSTTMQSALIVMSMSPNLNVLINILKHCLLALPFGANLSYLVLFAIW